jgi:hypothetical protein
MKGLLSEEEELRRFNAAQGGEQPWYAKALPMEGRATILPFRDSMPGSVFNKREFALPGLLAEAVNAFTSPARALLGTDADFYPEKEAANMALNMFGGGIATGKALTNPTGVGGTDLALNVWHGTPHEIKGKFDISKVGTGEGAQAYGHGMYFGGARETGEKYALDLANRDISNQNRLNPHANAQRLVKLAGDPKYAADDIKFVLETSPDHAQKELLSATLKMIETGDYAKPLQTTGNLYKVDIPDEMIPKMINWDKPFSEQPASVQAAFNKFDPIAAKDKDRNTMYMQRWFRDPSTAKELQELGFTGFQYLDEGSRGAGKGTSNYVVFDPSTVKILEKNDIKIEDLIEKGLLGD